jgi:hypothetical protein
VEEQEEGFDFAWFDRVGRLANPSIWPFCGTASSLAAQLHLETDSSRSAALASRRSRLRCIRERNALADRQRRVALSVFLDAR